MINKPAGYDNAPVYGAGDFETVTPGGHICRIRAAKEEVSNGNRQLVIAFDLAENDAQAGYYSRQYEQRVRGDINAKWPGVYRQGIDGNSTPFFKGLITAIERSNPGFIWNWDENSLKGKLFGGVFGREEYMGTDGKPRWSCKVRFVRSVEGVEDVSAPEDKPLSNHPAQPAYGDYAALAQSHSSAGIGATNLPF